MDLCHLRHINHITDQCIEYPMPETFGSYCSMSTGYLGFRGDSGYFFTIIIVISYGCNPYGQYIFIPIGLEEFFIKPPKQQRDSQG